VSGCGRHARGDRVPLAVVAAPPAAPASEALTLVVPGVGPLELRETVHLLREENQLLGFVLADDSAGELCVVTLAVDRDIRGWWGSIERVVRKSGGVHVPPGSIVRLANHELRP
jgi:hypothetical protein